MKREDIFFGICIIVGILQLMVAAIIAFHAAFTGAEEEGLVQFLLMLPALPLLGFAAILNAAAARRGLIRAVIFLLFYGFGFFLVTFEAIALEWLTSHLIFPLRSMEIFPSQQGMGGMFLGGALIGMVLVKRGFKHPPRRRRHRYR